MKIIITDYTKNENFCNKSPEPLLTNYALLLVVTDKNECFDAATEVKPHHFYKLINLQYPQYRTSDPQWEYKIPPKRIARMPFCFASFIPLEDTKDEEDLRDLEELLEWVYSVSIIWFLTFVQGGRGLYTMGWPGLNVGAKEDASSPPIIQIHRQQCSFSCKVNESCGNPPSLSGLKT